MHSCMCIQWNICNKNKNYGHKTASLDQFSEVFTWSSQVFSQILFSKMLSAKTSPNFHINYVTLIKIALKFLEVESY